MATLTAANSTEFATQRAAAVGGDVIVLTGTDTGTYGQAGFVPAYTGFSWSNQYSSTVRVIPNDVNNPPTIDFQNIDNASWSCANVTLEDLQITKQWKSGDGNNEQCIRGDNLKNFEMNRCMVIGGTTSGGLSNGRFMQAIGTGTNTLTFRECEFHKWHKPFTMGGCQNLNYILCEFEDIRSDGVTLDAITNVLFDRCYWHNFAIGVGGGHPDMVQVTRNSNRQWGTTGLILQYGIMDASYGRYGQGFFSGNGGNGGYGTYGHVWRHTGWHVHNNVLYIDHKNTMLHDAVDDSLWERNTLFEVENGYPYNAWANLQVGGYNNTYDKNVSETLNPGQNPNILSHVYQTQAQIQSNFNIIASETYPTPGVVGTLTNDGYHDFEIKSGAAVWNADAGSFVMKREGGWGGRGIKPHPNYPGGFSNPTTPPVNPRQPFYIGGKPVVIDGKVFVSE